MTSCRPHAMVGGTEPNPVGHTQGELMTTPTMAGAAQGARVPLTMRVVQVLLVPLAFFTTVGGIVFNLVPGAPGSVPLGMALVAAGLSYATAVVLLSRRPHRGWLLANGVVAAHFLWGVIQKLIIEGEPEAFVFAAVQLIILVALNVPVTRRYVESHR